MHFVPIINRIGIPTLALALELPTKNIRRWIDNDSIPADWFSSVARTARRLGHREITPSYLADIAERRRLSKEAA